MTSVKNLPAMQETWRSRFKSLGREVPLKEEMATHSRILAWRIPWTEEPGGLQSMGSQRVQHNLADSTHTLVCSSWPSLCGSSFFSLGEWQPTPVFLPGESQGRGEKSDLTDCIMHILLSSPLCCSQHGSAKSLQSCPTLCDPVDS